MVPEVATVGVRTAARRRRRLRWLSRALFAVAIVAALQPSLTGVYTGYRQQQLKAGLEERFTAAQRATPSREASSTAKAQDPFEGWRQEDGEYWTRLKEGDVFGRLVIPRLKLDVALVKGVGKADLKEGPGWAPWTALPGRTGNVGISGHRTTYLAPFRHIDMMKRGDEIRIESPFRVYTYRVTNQFIVEPSDVGVFGHSDRPILTLTACHPPYTADKRLVTRAQLVRVERR